MDLDAEEQEVPSRLGLHSAVLLFALVLLACLAGPRTSISSDEGAAIHQAVLLQRGGWLLSPTLPELDPELVRQPFLRADAGPKGRAPYAKHPAYPLLLQKVIRAWGLNAMLVPGVLGTWVAAVAAALLARALRPGVALPALWVVGLGSPLTVDSQLVLAHAPAAGSAAVAALAAGVVLAPDRFGRLATGRWPAQAQAAAISLASVAAGATAALRGEGVLLVGGLALGALCCGSKLRRSVPLAVALLAGAAAARVIEIAAISSILGAAPATVTSAPVGSGDPLGERIEAFHASWLDVSYDGHRSAALLGGAMGALVLAVLAARMRVRPPLILGIAGSALLSTLGWLGLGDTGLVPGLLPATPWLLAALVSIRSWLKKGLTRFLAVASLAAASAILATQYSFGGGVEWGGRFYAVVLPVVAPLAIGVLWPASPRWWTAGAAPALAAVGASALVSLGGLMAVRSGHEASAALGREVAAAARAAPPGRPGDPDQRAVVVGAQRLWPQLLWPVFDDHRWVTAEPPGLPCTLFGLRAGGFDRLVLLGPEPDAIVDVAERQGWRPVEGHGGRFTRVVEVDSARQVPQPSCTTEPGSTTPVASPG